MDGDGANHTNALGEVGRDVDDEDSDDLQEKRETEFIAAVAELRERLFNDLAAGRMETTLKLRTMTWLTLLDEIEQRNPRNYSQLVRDDFMDRLEEKLARLNHEITYIVAHGGDDAAQRYSGKAQRQYASRALQESLRSKPNAKP